MKENPDIQPHLASMSASASEPGSASVSVSDDSGSASASDHELKTSSPHALTPQQSMRPSSANHSEEYYRTSEKWPEESLEWVANSSHGLTERLPDESRRWTTLAVMVLAFAMIPERW